jgi:hypothetical protein
MKGIRQLVVDVFKMYQRVCSMSMNLKKKQRVGCLRPEAPCMIIFLTGERVFTILVCMVTNLDDAINVGAVFSRGELKPVWFSWRGRQVRILRTTFSWKTREGHARILHFSVTDGQGVYEIRYNQETMGWRLVRCE